MSDLRAIVAQHAATHGWPAELALKYFSDYLKFEIGFPQLAAIQLFHDLAAAHGIIPRSKALAVY